MCHIYKEGIMNIKTFMGRLDKYIKEYPIETEKAMRKEANRMKRN